MATIEKAVHEPEQINSTEAHSPIDSDDPSSFTSVKCPPSVNEKALIRKIDFRVVPILFLLYVAAFLDRVNISNALTLGLQKDLKLKSDQANVALTIFFVPYVLFEVPSNILLKRFKPHVWCMESELLDIKRR